MNVSDLMKKDIAACGPRDDLATVAKLMHGRRCGFLPVVDTHGSVTGVLTDRDVCLFAADTSRSLSQILVHDVMSHPPVCCFPEEDLKTVLTTMAKHHVRRLPVVDDHGRLQGVLSIDDVVAAPRLQGAPTAEDIVDALKGINSPRPVEVVAG